MKHFIFAAVFLSISSASVAMPIDAQLGKRQNAEPASYQSIKLQLEQLAGYELDAAQSEELARAVQDLHETDIASVLQVKDDGKTGVEIGDDAGKPSAKWEFLFCAGGDAGFGVHGQVELCVDQHRQKYKVLGVGAVSTGFHASFGVWVVRVYDGDVTGSYDGLQGGLSAGWLGANAGGYVKSVKNENGKEVPTTWSDADLAVRGRYAPGISVEAGYNAIWISHL